MSYADNITKDHVEVNYFIRVGSRIEIDETWSMFTDPVYGADIYHIPWDDQPVGRISFLNALLVKQAPEFIEAHSYEKMLNPTLNGNLRDSIFYDSKAKILYLNPISSGLTINGTHRIFAERFYYLSTQHVGFHNKPDDDTFPHVQWHGTLASAPNIVSSVNQIIYGNLPAQAGSITVSNENGYLSGGFFEGSLANCTFEVYRCVGPIFAENVQLVFRGFTREAQFSDSNVSISYIDASSLLDNVLRNTRLGASVDPALVGAIQRQFLCGRMNRQLAVCTNYDASKTLSVNRTWNFGDRFNAGGSGAAFQYVTYTTDNALTGSNTTTRTYLDSVGDLETGDWIQRNTSLTLNYTITAVGANYIDHDTLASPMGASDTFRKTKVQGVFVLHKRTGQVEALGATSFTQINEQQVTLISDIETPIGFIDPINPDDYVVYGNIELGCGALDFLDTGDPLGSVNPATGYNQNPVQLIYELLYGAGFYNADIYFDSASFIATANATDIQIDASSPFAYNAFAADKFRDVISRICQTALLKLYMKNGKWFISQMEPLGAVDQTFYVHQIKQGFSYQLQSDDIVKDVTVKYDRGEVTVGGTLGGESIRAVTATNGLAQGINGNDKSLTIEALTSDETMAETIRDRLLYVFSYPLGFFKLELELGAVDLNLGDTVKISVEDFPNLPFTADKTFSVVSIKENADSIEVELFDQRGIEENTGSW